MVWCYRITLIEYEPKRPTESLVLVERSKRMNKTLSAILSFAPLVLLIIACAGLFITSFALGMDNELVGGARVAMILILICEIVAVIATFGMMIWYIIKTCKNPNFTSGEKVLWVILLYMLNIFVFPVYWFMFVKNE